MPLQQYSNQVTCMPNGVYRWRSNVDRSYYFSKIMLGFKVCSCISLVILAVGLGLYLFSRSTSLLIILLSCAIGFFALSALIFGLTAVISSNPGELFELAETYVKTGSGRYATWFMFEQTKKLIITRRYLELRGRFSVMRVYAPEEDMALVRDFIRRRMPDEAEITFE